MGDVSGRAERYDLGLLFTDGLPELDDQAGYRGAVAARGRWRCAQMCSEELARLWG